MLSWVRRLWKAAFKIRSRWQQAAIDPVSPIQLEYGSSLSERVRRRDRNCFTAALLFLLAFLSFVTFVIYLAVRSDNS